MITGNFFACCSLWVFVNDMAVISMLCNAYFELSNWRRVAEKKYRSHSSIILAAEKESLLCLDVWIYQNINAWSFTKEKYLRFINC